MIVKSYEISGLRAFLPCRVADARGWFADTFRLDLFARHCGDVLFVQDNEVRNLAAGTVRGLHYQRPPHAQGKLVRCTAGAILDVAVDIRAGSPTYGRWITEVLTPDNGMQLWIPPGFAHGFCTLETDTVVAWKVTDYHCQECDLGLRWNDPALAIAWPVLAVAANVSPKDRAQPLIGERPAHFIFEELAECA